MDAQEKSLLASVLIGCIFAAIVIAYFVITILKHHKRSLRLYKERLRAEITTLENERERIAADLHDELAPVLLAANMNMNSLEIESTEDREIVRKTSRNIENSIGRIREISNNLLPAALLRKGLIVALQESIENLKRKTDLEIILHYEDIPELEHEKLINIFRMVQEIIQNTIKHSKATILRINLDKKNRMLLISTNDNGIGFDYKKKVSDNSGLGLRNLYSRTEMLKGKMYLESKIGKGTIFSFEIPL